LLAMVVNDNAGHLIPLGAWATIASKLAPTLCLLAIAIFQTKQTPTAYAAHPLVPPAVEKPITTPI